MYEIIIKYIGEIFFSPYTPLQHHVLRTYNYDNIIYYIITYIHIYSYTTCHITIPHTQTHIVGLILYILCVCRAIILRAYLYIYICICICDACPHATHVYLPVYNIYSTVIL
jgi:hypothetical protein